MATTFRARWPDGYETTWRNLTWKEFRKLLPLIQKTFLPEADRDPNQASISPMSLFLEVYKICRIDGPEPVIAPAGIVDWIGRQQIKNNPFNGQYKDLQNMADAARSVVRGNYLLSIKGIIASALHYTMDEIDAMDADELFVRLAQTELIIGYPLNPEDPNRIQEQQKPTKKKPSAIELARQRVRERDASG